MNRPENNRRLLDLKLEGNQERNASQSDTLRQAIEDTKREIRKAFSGKVVQAKPK